LQGHARIERKLNHPRVLRGGAFNNNSRNVRCAYRNNNNPDNRNNNIGFRVVVSTFFFENAGNALRRLGSFALQRRGLKNGGACSWPALNPNLYLP